MVRELTELSSQEIIKIIGSGHSFLITFESVARKRYIPSEPSSSEIIKFIGSRYCFLMSFEKVSRKRNMPCEPLSSEVIQIIWSRHGFSNEFGEGSQKQRHTFLERCEKVPGARGESRRAQNLKIILKSRFPEEINTF